MVHPLSEGYEHPYALRKRIEEETGAFEWAPCEGPTKTGKPCGNAAMKYCERPVCPVHGTEKEVALNRILTGTARARTQVEEVFGDI